MNEKSRVYFADHLEPGVSQTMIMKFKVLLALLMFGCMCDSSGQKSNNKKEEKMKVIYIMDPLCGWCYGNIDNTSKLFKEFRDRVEFEVLPGGMWSAGNRRIQSEQMMNYFLKHDAVITERTGIRFGEAYINFIKTRHDVVLDSEIPSRAIVTVNKIAPAFTVPFTVEVQRARYFYGKDLNLDETYTEILMKLGIDEKLFFHHFDSDDLKRATQDTFRKAASFARSYPTMLVEKDGTVYMLEQGYAPLEELTNSINQLLQDQTAK